MNNGRKQHFLEVYLPNLSSQRLKIPSNFIKHLTGRTSGLVSLMGPSGNSWHVHLVEVTGNLYFDDGWNVFVRDHSIEYGDSLVFGYDENMGFTVQIFDQTSCEKEEAFYANCSQEQSNLSGSLANKRSEGEAALSGALDEKIMRLSWIPTHVDLEFGTDFKLETSGGEGQEHEESLRNSCDNSYRSSEPSVRPFLLALPAEGNSQMLLPSMNEWKKKNDVSLETFYKTRTLLKRKKNDVSSETSYKTRTMLRRKKNDVSSETSYKTRTLLRRKKNDVSSETSYKTRTMPRRKKNDASPETSYKTRTMPRRKKNDASSETSYKTRIMPIRKKNALVPKTTKSKNEVRSWIKQCIYKKIEENAAQRFTSSFPYFVKYMNSYNAKGGAIHVPVLFSEEHFPACRILFTLRNLDGRSWVVNVVPSRRKYSTIYTFSAGWSNFIRDNQIKEKDICVFELVAKDEMRVHISRPGLKWIGRSKIILKDNSKKLVDINELSMDDFEEHTKVSEMTCQEIASSSDTNIHNSTTRNKRKDQLPQCNAKDARSYQTRGKMKDPFAFTSPLPHFMKVMARSNVSGKSTLEIPMEFSSKHLPSCKKKVILRNMNGERWHVFSCPHKRRTNFIGGWPSFVRQNDLKVGDICIFELVNKWVLQVQVFKSRHGVEDSSDTDDFSENDPDYELKDECD